jgi:hypothetical protein
MAAMFHCLARAKRLFLLAVLFLFCLALPARAIRCDATAFGNGFEKQLKEEQPVSGQEAYTGDFALGEEGRIGLFVGNNPVNNVDPYGLTWVLFDSQAWGQLLHNIFYGANYQSPFTFGPQSQLGMRNAAGVGVTQLTDENGNRVQPGNVVPGALFSAAGNIMMLPMGEEEGAYDAAAEALKAADAAKAAKAAKNCPKFEFSFKTAQPDEVYRRLMKDHGINPTLASERLHAIKAANGFGAADNVVLDLTGNVYNPGTGDWIGSLTAGGAKGQ